MATPIDLANRQQIYLERLKAGFDRDWNAVHISLRERVRRVLALLDIEELQELDRRELQKVLFNLRAAMVEVYAPALTDFVAELEDLAAFAAAKESKDLASLVANPPAFNTPTAKIAYQSALANPIQATGELLEPFLANFQTSQTRLLSNLVQKGWAQNLTLQDMVRQAIGTKAKGYADGFLDVSKRHASTMIHTATQHVANAARQATWEANGDIVKQYQWLSTLDRRTTQQCKSLDGRVFDAGKGPMPPIHPNCRSTTVAVLPPEFKFLDEDATRASAGPNPGYVDGDLQYYDWLKQQPAGFQDFAIGPTRGKLFRDGGLTPDRFAALNLGRNFEPLTLAQMRELEPEAFRLAGL